MRALVRSHGVIDTATLSSGRMRMPCTPIYPEMWPVTTCPFPHLAWNVALGGFSGTSPCLRMKSSFNMAVSGQSVVLKLAFLSSDSRC